MRLANHGWGGGGYEVAEATLCVQLSDLVARQLLKVIELEEGDFWVRPPKTAEENAIMDGEIRKAHAPGTPTDLERHRARGST